MSARNCLVVVRYKDVEPVVVSCPKHGFFSRKEALRKATDYVRHVGAQSADVVEVIQTVNP